MVEILGTFIDNPSDYQEYMVLRFAPSDTPLEQRWRNNGISANFIADYLATFLFNYADKQKELKETVSYIANELLENTMKFHYEVSQQPVSIQLCLYPDNLLLFTTNSINPKQIPKFQTYIQQLIHSDPQELWLEKLTQEEIEDTEEGSQLGLLTMLVHHQAKLGWKFETVSNRPETIMLTTMVQLTI